MSPERFMAMSDASTDVGGVTDVESDGAGCWGTSWGVEGMHAGIVADVDVLGLGSAWVVASTAEDGSIFLHQAASTGLPMPVCQSCFHLPDADAKGTAIRLFQQKKGATEDLTMPLVMTGDSNGSVRIWTSMGSLMS